MAFVRLSRRAVRDIEGIAVYIAQDDPNAAAEYVDRLQARFQILAENPRMGRDADDFGVDVRAFPIGNYVVFYRAVSGGVLIVRVLHGARNLAQVFKAD